MRKRSLVYGLGVALVAGIIALPMFLNAKAAEYPQNAENGQASAPTKSAKEIKLSDMSLADLMAVMASPQDALPREMQDPAFRQYVDLSLLSTAWNELDPGLMTDVALQLQEGERILHRPHRAISSKDLLKTAAKIAGETNNEATLARIKAAAESTGDKELAGQVAVAAKLGGSARAMTPQVQVPLGTLQTTDYADLQGFMLAVRAARLAGEVDVLESLAKEASKLSGLSKQQQDALQKTIAESLTMVKQAGKGDATAQTLEKIRGATRHFIGYIGHGGGHGHFGGGHGHYGGHWGHGGGQGHFGGHYGGHYGGHGGGHYGGHYGGHGHHGFH